MTSPDIAAQIDRIATMFQTSMPEDATSTLEQRRAGLNEVFGQLPVRHGATVTAATYGGVEGFWVQAAGASNDRIGILLHGGGYSLGSAKGYRGFGSEVSWASDARVFVADYPLVPEHPYPAAIEQATSMLRAAMDEVGRESCFAIGDSAGGGLVLSTLMNLHAMGAPLPACSVTVSALIDLTVTNPSYEELATVDPICTPPGTRRNAGLYLDGRGPDEAPLAFPMLSDLGWLPPVLVLVGGREVLRDDSRNLADKLHREGVEYELSEYEDMVHVWPLFASFVPQAEEAVEEIGAFVIKHTSKAGATSKS